MSNCQYCGYELTAGSAFCWNCGKNEPLKGSKSAGSGSNKGLKIALIVIGSLVGVVVAVGGAIFVTSQLNTPAVVLPIPTPSDDGGFSKQDGNSAGLPGQTLSNSNNQR